MLVNDLPTEILKVVLRHATYCSMEPEEYGFMADHRWAWMPYGSWLIRNPLEASNAIERRGYRTKKNIVLVCKLWYQLGIEHLFGSVLLEKPEQLGSIAQIVQGHPELAWWVERMTIHPYIPQREAASSGVATVLQATLCLCQSLEEIHLSFWFSDESTLAIASRLPTSLRRLVWTVQSHTSALLADVLSRLQALEVLDLSVTDPETEQSEHQITVTPPSEVVMPELWSLSLRGQQAELLNVVVQWKMPKLCSLSFQFLSDPICNKLGLVILNQHASQLEILDLDTVMPWDVASILDRCPNLEQLAFNPDWPLKRLAHQPHRNLNCIGLHELWYASEVGQGALFSTMYPIRAAGIRGSNNRNILNITRTSFPEIERVRLLNTGLIQAICRTNGPNERQIPLWHGWIQHAKTERFLLEDCTGNPLGTDPATLPVDPQWDSETEAETETESDAESWGPEGERSEN
jgi:hypothetical protein